MILWLSRILASMYGWHIPVAFTHISMRMMFAALTALFMTLACGPRIIRRLYTLKTGQTTRIEDCPLLAQLHEKKKETPSMGGVLILISMLIALFLWMDLRSSFTHLLALATLWLGGLGGTDDYLKMKYRNAKGLSAKKKFVLQNLFAFFVALYLFVPVVSNAVVLGKWFSPPVAKEVVQLEEMEKRQPIVLRTQEYMSRYFFPFTKGSIFTLKESMIVFGIAFTMFIITGTSNAVNLTDGLDGLAAGCLVLVASVLALVAFFSNNVEMARYLNMLYIEGSGEIAIYLFALVGACLGFLWYNGYPAQVIMGDTGSLALGGIIGLSAVLLRREFLLALIGGIFVAETVSVILQVGSYRLRDRKRLFLCAPLHHHYEYKGWPENKVVLRFWMIGLILALIGVASLEIH
jgi:phospho-N-acetylmuramoyl-pentapeptide-transferase